MARGQPPREWIGLDDAPQQVRPAAAGLLAGPIGRRDDDYGWLLLSTVGADAGRR